VQKGQPVEIHLQSKQRIGNKEEVMEKDLLGNYFCKEKAHYFAYQEKARQRIVIKVKDDSLTLIQSGENSWNHLFRMGETNVSTYLTPYGSFGLEVTTKFLKVEKKNDTFFIQLSYSLFGGDGEGTEIDLNLTVSKRGEGNANSDL